MENADVIDLFLKEVKKMNITLKCLVLTGILSGALMGCGGGESPKTDTTLSSTATSLGISEMRATEPTLDVIAGATASGTVSKISLDQLCVTNGKISTLPNGNLDIATGSSRAFVRRNSAQIAKIDFIYRGQSAEVIPLASGEVRRQIGLKLKALDGCNVAYAMWNVDTSRITVGVKSNPTIHTSKCGDGGYINLPSFAANHVAIGENHSMRADLVGQELKIYLDQADKPIKTLLLPKEINAFDGPVGLRTDNGHFEVAFLSAAGSAGPNAPPLACDSLANSNH